MSMIQVSHLTFCYEGGMEPVFEDVSFRIDTDWKLGLTGRNGRGKTTLLKLLMGAYEYTGSIQGDVQMEYFPVVFLGNRVFIKRKEFESWIKHRKGAGTYGIHQRT